MPQFSFGTPWIHTRTFSFGTPTASTRVFKQPVRPELRQRWELLNLSFQEAPIAACDSPWTLKMLRLLGRHSERHRRRAIDLVDAGRDVHAEHRQIFELAMAGQEPRVALALEAHICATPGLLARASAGGWTGL